MYTIVKKWSKDSKLRNACYKLMSTMVVNGNITFITTQAQDMLTNVLSALKVIQFGVFQWIDCIDRKLKIRNHC